MGTAPQGSEVADDEVTGIWQRLKQRKLVQWALAYLAGAWVLLQVLGLAADSYDWPRAVMQWAFGVIALGFVVNLLLAWYHGERGEQKVSGTELLLLALVLAVGGGLLWRFAPMPSPAPERAQAANPGMNPTAAGGEIPAKSIAVLPFENLSSDKENEYFVSGMQDLILTKLSEVRELRVASRTSTDKYAEHHGSVHEIATELGVAYVLEGSVQKAGNRVLINLQLIDARNDQHLWAQAYQRTLDDIFGVEGEVAKLVADALHMELSVAEAARVASVGTHDKQAYDRLLRSRFFLNQSNRSFDTADLDRSIEMAKQAVAIDPNFVDAWTLLSLAYAKRGGPGAAAKAEASARKALALDPDDAKARLHLGFSLQMRGRNEEAIAEAREAARLRPDQMSIQTGLGITLANAGRVQEAKAPLEAAATLSPENNFARNSLALVDVSLREYAQGRDLAQAMLARDPADLFALSVLVEAQLQGFGDIEGARRSLRALPLSPSESATVAMLASRVEFWARDFDAARQLIEQAPPGTTLVSNAPRALSLAQILRAQGDAKAARAAYALARNELQASIEADPDNAQLHSALAQALAGLGEHAEALHVAESAVLMPSADFGTRLQGRAVLAEVQMRAGRVDEAVQTLRGLMEAPAGSLLSQQSLRLDPTWDPLRKDPDFQALLEQYAAHKPALNPTTQAAKR